jgi:hypothetical protein
MARSLAGLIGLECATVIANSGLLALFPKTRENPLGAAKTKRRPRA